MKTQVIDYLLSTLLIFVIVLMTIIIVFSVVYPITSQYIGNYHVVADFFSFLLVYGVLSCLVLRVLLRTTSLRPGRYSMDSSVFMQWKLFTVIYEFGRGALLPFTVVFLRPVMAKLLGAKVGENVAIGGHLVDPQFIEIGDNVIIGQSSVITAHTINSGELILKSVHIGANATVGVHAVLMSGVEVGEYAVIAAGAVVPPDTKIPPYELWGGVPAKRISRLMSQKSN